MCEWFDQTIGELLQQLENKGLSENTLVIYACDNGWIQNPEKRNVYMSGSKQDPNEMGIRTPLIFRWPNRITPGLDTTTLVSTVDLVPTMLDATSTRSEEPTSELQSLMRISYAVFCLKQKTDNNQFI